MAPTVEFTVQGADVEVTLHADEERLRQVLHNLISNAVKYGGDPARVDLILEMTPSSATVRVRDHGIGIAAHELPRLFERFHRAEGSRGGGHGLGLYIANALTRLHGGTLAATSVLGEGTTFSVTLPLSSASPRYGA